MRMLCGQSNAIWHYAAGRWPDKTGLLLGPSYCKKTVPQRWHPYVLDNDRFSAWSKGKEWSERAWLDMLEWVKLLGHKPDWVLVPDVVGDRDATLREWDRYLPVASRYGWPVAFAVQDGMTPADVPADADVVFVGGTTEWKWRNIEMWKSFPRVHVGRVNEIDRVWQCQDLGCESVDGTGWFRDPTRQDKLPALVDWMKGDRYSTTTELKL